MFSVVSLLLSVLQIFTIEGKFLRKLATSQLHCPVGVAFDAAANALVTSFHNHRVLVFHKDGTLLTSFGEHGTSPGQFVNPYGICVDGDGRILVGARDCPVQAFGFSKLAED